MLLVYPPLQSGAEPHRSGRLRSARTVKRAGEGPVAQRSEQGTHNPLVAGSIPAGPTDQLAAQSTFFPRLSQALYLPPNIPPNNFGGTEWREACDL